MTVLLGLSACVGSEPDFQAESLREHPSFEDEALPEAEGDGDLPDFEALRAAGLERTLSEGTPPPPFLPDDAHYPRVRGDGNFEVALRGGVPHLVDVLSLEPDESGAVIITRDVTTSEESRIVLPTHYQCSTQTTVLEGGRYVLLTWPADRAGRSTLYLGVGAEYSVLPVDRGYVRTPLGAREAEALIADARRGS